MRERIDLGVGIGPSFRSGELGFRELGVAKPSVLICLLSFVVVPLSCVVASPAADSLSDSLEVLEPCGKFFYRVAILKQVE